MKIFSSEFLKINDKMLAKSVIMQKKGNSFVLLRHYNTDAENIQPLSKGLPLNIGFECYDAVNQSIQMPPIKDNKTFNIIAKNKIKESVDADTEYLMAHKENELEVPSQGMVSYEVFLAPRTYFDTELKLSDEQKHNINLFTVSDYALCALVKNYFPDKIVFHAHADGTKISVAVCHNDLILYTRSSAIQNTGDISSAYYEYLNLTYMYAVKNLRLTVEHIIFSGDLADHEDLSSMFFEFSGIYISTLIPGKHVLNCNQETFQKYMIPISMCFLSDTYDMTPPDIMEQQGKNTVTLIANCTAVIIVLMLIMMNALSFLNLVEAKEDVAIQGEALSQKIISYSKEISNLDNRKYGLYYYKNLLAHNSEAIRRFPEFAPIIGLADFDTVSFDTDDMGNTFIDIAGELSFNRISNMEAFKDRLASGMNNINSLKKYAVTDESKFSPDILKASIKLRFGTDKNNQPIKAGAGG